MADQTNRVWDAPRELGSVQSITAVGGTPISVLAGFSLTSAITLASARGGVWRDVAVSLFAIAAGSFILALTLIVEAISYAASPDVRLAFTPEAKVSEDVLQQERRMQREDEWLLDIYNKRIMRSTVAGVVSAVLGLGAALLRARVSWGVLVGVVVLAPIAVLIVLNHFGKAEWLYPRPSRVPHEHRTPEPLDEVGRAAVFIGRSGPYHPSSKQPGATPGTEVRPP